MPSTSAEMDFEESETLLNGSVSKTAWRAKDQKTKLPWLITGVSIGVAVASLIVNLLQWTNANSCVHPTDFPDARKAIQYEQRTFTGALTYDSETKHAIRLHDAPIEYFGPPSDEIDDAWHTLLKNEFPTMTAEEAKPYEPELKRLPNTHEFHFEPDVFHSLHCLNAVRKEIGRSLYPDSPAPPHHHGADMPDHWDQAHMEHCMDRIRQSLMCHGDLTASPMYYWPGFNTALGRTGPHTCRKWEPIREWMNGRAANGKAMG